MMATWQRCGIALVAILMVAWAVICTMHPNIFYGQW